MTTSARYIPRLAMLFAVLATIVGALWLPAPGVAAPGSAVARAVGIAPEIFDFVQINLADPEGDTVTFPAGQEICLSVTIDPPLTPGGTPWITHCYSDLPGQTLHANRPASPFLRSSNYSIAVVSNTTNCDVRVPTMLPQDFGESGWYAIFNVTVSCAAPPLPTVVIPDPTRVAPLPTVTFPTPSPTIDTTTPTDVPLVEGYERVTLQFVPASAGDTPAILPGEICARIVVNPALSGDPLVDHCHTRSTGFRDYFPTAERPFPLASRYSAIVVSNASGCTATPGAFREYLRDFGEAAELDVIIDCSGLPLPPTMTPVPTLTPVPPTSTPRPEHYDVAALVFSPVGDTPAVLPGPICARLVVDPPVERSTPMEFCSSDPTTNMGYGPEPGSPFPTTSTYSATVLSNESGCSAVPAAWREGTGVSGFIGMALVEIDCDVPADPTITADPSETAEATEAPDAGIYSRIALLYQDVRGGGGSYDYAGDLCVDVTVDPPLSTGPLLGSFCADSSPRGPTWNTTEDVVWPADSRYTATITSNDTGCAAVVETGLRDHMSRIGEEPDGSLRGMIVVWIDCDDPAATATPPPTTEPTETAIATSGSTTVPGTVSPGATGAPSPTAASTEPDAATSPPGPTTPADATDVPVELATATDGQAVTGLPTTGTGPTGGIPGGALLLLVGVLFVLGAGLMHRLRGR